MRIVAVVALALILFPVLGATFGMALGAILNVLHRDIKDRRPWRLSGATSVPHGGNVAQPASVISALWETANSADHQENDSDIVM